MLYLILVRSKLAEARYVGVSPAIIFNFQFVSLARDRKMHTHQRNMPHGIAGKMPTSLVV